MRLHTRPLPASNLLGLSRHHLSLRLPPRPIRVFQLRSLTSNRLLAARFRQLGALEIRLGSSLGTRKFVNFQQKLVPLPGGKSEIKSFQFIENFTVPTCFTRLALQRPYLATNFPQNIGQSKKIRFGSFQFPLRLTLLNLETHHSCGFFKNGPAIFWFRGENLVDLPLLHDRVSGPTNASIQKKPLNILEPAVHPIERVLSHPVAKHPAGNLNLMVISP